MWIRAASWLCVLSALALAACGGTTGSAGGGNSSTPPQGTPPPGAPAVVLNASPVTVPAGGSTTLTWNSTGATACSASGAWSGARVTSGSETIASLVSTSLFALTCTGAGGSTARSVTVVVSGAGAGVSGAIDSSLLDRHNGAANGVYVFSGSGNTSGTPVATAPVRQDSGACTFRYEIAGLADGPYTVALTNDGGASFRRSVDVTVAGGMVTQDFEPTRVIRVGPGRQYTHPSQVTNVVREGDVVEIDAGVYNGPASTWYTDNLTLRGVGGRAHLVAPSTISNGKGIWVTAGDNIAVENIEFSGAAVPDRNGAGIRAEGRHLVVCNSYFHDNENGILGGNGNTLVEYSEFSNNGYCGPSGENCAHNMYILSGRFTLRHSYSHHARIGHTVKSRAQENYILYNRIMDEATGRSSYIIDLPNGGLSYIIGNVLQQGPLNENSTIVTYGAEGLSGSNRTLYVINNTIVNDDTSGTFLSIASGATAIVRNNLFVGNGTAIRGPATQAGNLQTNTPNFVNRAAFDYRPTATTPGLNAGVAPGTAGSFDLTPAYQYVHPANRETRPSDGAIDIGAYEYQAP